MNDEHEHVCECGEKMVCRGDDAIECRLPHEAMCVACTLTMCARPGA